MGDVFKALADPTRRTILDELVESDGQILFELCTRLTTKHGLRSSRQAVSQHLDVLEDAGLVTTRRDGRYKFHHLDTSPPPVDHRPVAPRPMKTAMPQITITSVFVDDQEKALRFYVDVLGFVPKNDIVIWTRFPQVSSRTAMVTSPIVTGSMEDVHAEFDAGAPLHPERRLTRYTRGVCSPPRPGRPRCCRTAVAGTS